MLIEDRHRNDQKWKKRRILVGLLSFILIIIGGFFGLSKIKYVNAGDSLVSNLPDDISNLTLKEYSITNTADWVQLQKLSTQEGQSGKTLKGIKFIVYGNNAEGQDSKVYDLSKVAGFTGIGTEAKPFQGTIESNLKGVRIKTNVPLFQYISPVAKISGLYLECSKKGGFANVMLYDGTEDISFEIKDITFTFDDSEADHYTIEKDANAGILFNQVINKSDSEVKIMAVKVTSSVFDGRSVGLAFEKINQPIQISGIKSTGLLIGSMTGNVEFVYDATNISLPSQKTLIRTTDTYGNAGSLIGFIDGGKISVQSDCSIFAEISSSGTYAYNGGLVGYAKDALIQIKSGKSIKGDSIRLSGSRVGGIAGNLINSKVTTIEGTGYFNVNTVTYKDCSYTGGIAGIITNSVVEHAKVSSCTAENVTNFGGIAGLGNYNDSSERSVVRNCIVDLLDSTIGFPEKNGKFGGCIVELKAAKTKKGTAVNIENIEVCVDTSQINAAVFGGLIGKMNEGSSLQLDQNIDLSKVTGGYRQQRFGSIIGQKLEGLAYQQKTAVVIKADDSSCQMDEIGSFDGVIRNNSNLIQDHELLGTLNDSGNGITKTVDQTYELSTADGVVRLAIYLQTNGRFGNAFFNDGSNTIDVNDLLKATYCLTADINLKDTGIYTINRNDITNSAYFFSGTFTSDKKSSPYRKITLDQQTFTQGNLGLFAGTSNAVFEYINLQASITMKSGDNNSYNKNAGGLTSYALGGITAKNCIINADFTQPSESSTNRQYYGGIAGQCKLNGGTIKVDIDTIQLNINYSNVGKYHYSGGAIGYINVAGNTKSTSGISLKNISIFGKMQGDSSEAAIVGGLIAVIDDGKKFDDDSGSRNFMDAPVSLIAQKVNLYGLQFDFPYAKKCGGLLGYSWENVTSSISSITTGKNSAGNVTKLSVPKGNAGGLLYYTFGRTILDNIQLSNFTFEVSKDQNYSALLISDGRFAYITVKNYKIDSTTVTIPNKAQQMDEIVGINRGGDKDAAGVSEETDGSIKDYITGGILSIQDSPSVGDKMYQNQKLADNQANKFTRYYYGLDSILEDSSNQITLSGGKYLLDSPEKVVAWGACLYANATIKPLLYQAFRSDVDIDQSKLLYGSYTLKGDIDLTGYCYYPSTIVGGNYTGDGATITFSGDLATSGAGTKNPSDAVYQYYKLQSGLFEYTNSVDISKLEFKGNINPVNVHSGVLVNGSIRAGSKATITDITLNGVKLNTGTPSDLMALMIYDMRSDVTVKIDQIVMPEGAYSASNGYVASALIGNIGGSDALNITVNFTHMMLGANSSSLFSNALFVYNYKYSLNEVSTVAYDFTFDDYSKLDYTKGYELTDGVFYYMTPGYLDEECYVGLLPENRSAGPTFVLHDFRDDVGRKDLKPYIKKDYYILVNAKSLNITQGCGTYRDPYVIQNPGQLLSLFYLLKIAPKDLPNEEKNPSNVLKGWKVNLTGDDSMDPAKSYELVDYWKLDLTKMSSAYYKISNDLDMSSNKYNDFVGLGTNDLPFTGVIIGQIHEDQLPVIKMPLMNVNGSFTSINDYGLIMYAKGAVLKDLEVNFGNNPSSTVLPTRVNVKYNGGAIAKVIGGDNLIDHVKVSGAVKIDNEKARIGGYVGRVICGGVIFRNIESGYFSEFHIFSDKKTEVNNLLTNTTKYPYAGSMIGKMEEGFAFYDGKNGEIKEVPTLEFKDGFKESTMLPQCRTFHILNANYMSADKIGQIHLSNVKDDSLTMSVANAEQFEVLQLAVNSGTLYFKDDVRPEEIITDNDYAKPYTEQSHSRYSGYSTVGNVIEAAADSDYQSAVKENRSYNANAYQFVPYLQTYFDRAIYNSTNKRSNFINPANGKKKILTVQLTNSGVYDLSQFKNSYRGITSRFKGSLLGTVSGNECTTINLNLVIDRAIAYEDKEYAGVGLFRVLSNDTSNPYVFSDLRLTGTIVNSGKYAVWKDDSVQIPAIDSKQSRYVGGIAGTMNGKFLIRNVQAIDLNIQSDGAAGGMFGKCSNPNDSTMEAVIVDSTVHGSYETGGLIGITDWSSQLITLNNCSIQNATIISKSCAGGMIGKSSNSTTIIDTKQEKGKNTIDHVTLRTEDPYYSQLGGMIGFTQNESCKYLIQNVSISDNDISYACDVGGIIGRTYSEVEIINVKETNNSIRNDINGNGYVNCGGFFGYAKPAKLVIGVTTAQKDEMPNNEISNNIIVGNTFVGGVAGYMEFKADTVGRISNIEFLENKILADANHSQTRYIGGLIGQYALSSADYSFDSIRWNDNIIAQSCSSSSKENYRLGGMIGEVKDLDNTNVQPLKANHIIMNNNGIGTIAPVYLNDLSAINKSMCQMFNFITKSPESNRKFYSVMAENIPAGALTQEDEVNYASYTGLVFGLYSSQKESDIYDFHRSYDTAVNYARPVVDVGYNGVAASYRNLLDYQKLCHIYYGINHEVDEVLSDHLFTDDKLQDNKTPASKLSTVKSIMDQYTTSEADVRDKYGVTQLQDLMDQKIYDITYYGTNEGSQEDASYQSPFMEGTKVLPVIHYDSKCGDLNTVICDYLAAITNQTMDDEVASATATKAKLTLTNGSYHMTLDDPSLQEASIVIQDGKFVYNSGDFYNESDQSGSITLIKFSYSYDYPIMKTSNGDTLYSVDGKAVYEVIIPVFVEEILEINSYIRFMEGAQVDVTQMIANAAEKATINNNATYTIYAEFTYDGNYKRYHNLYLDRSIYCKSNGINTYFYPGTKLTLIDVMKNQVYYKIIEDEPEDSIALKEFQVSSTDMSSEHFSFTSFDQLSSCGERPTILKKEHSELDVADMGIEQFMIIIDTSEASKPLNGATSNIVYDVHVDKETLESKEDYQLDQRLIQNNLGTVSITEYPGFLIQFGNTKVDGKIAKDSVVSIKSSITIQAIQAFWQEYAKSQNQSYLELQISLEEILDDKITKQVSFPDQTKIYYCLNPEKNQVADIPYKQGKINYYLDKEMISKSLHDIAVNNIDYSIQTLDQALTLDFSDADLGGYNGNYQISLTLVRSDLKDSPESGSKLQEFIYPITAFSVPELAFAVDPLETSLLGMNVYKDDREQKIDFEASLGFDGFTQASEFEEAANSDYVMTVQLLEKTKTGYDRICDPGDTIRILNVKQDAVDTPSETEELTTNEFNQLSYTMTLSGEEALEARKGNKITRRFQLLADASKLNQSNYKVLIKVTALDQATGEEKAFSKDVKDFFIFCIANIKTD